jgi:hypothetical protein
VGSLHHLVSRLASRTPEAKAHFEATKQELSRATAGKKDFDDYTRAKTAFFDEVQDAFTEWARSGPIAPRRLSGRCGHSQVQ